VIDIGTPFQQQPHHREITAAYCFEQGRLTVTVGSVDQRGVLVEQRGNRRPATHRRCFRDFQTPVAGSACSR
jgi:hypothetical protein